MLAVKKTFFINLCVLFASLFSVEKTLALVTNDREPKIAFYKSKFSQFPSGETSLDTLTKNHIISAEIIDKNRTIKTEIEFYQSGFQKISKSLISPTFAKNLSLSAGYKDVGYFLTLTESYLKQKPHLNSTSLTKIANSTKLIPLKFLNGFIQVIVEGTKGYVDISNCISKFDYAYAVYAEHPKTKEKQWHYVKNRLFDQIELYDGTYINMSSVIGIFTNDKLAIITKKNEQLPIWSKVILKKQSSDLKAVRTLWNQSLISGHGLIWWKNISNDSEKQLNINMDEILKKEVYSISTHPSEPKKSIISIPEGVFITNDGLNWNAISQFKNYKGPVYYYNDNLIFVGSYRSTNHAKTFEQYINVGSISSVIKNKIGYNPQSVKIKKIRSIKPSQIVIDVDTGFKILKLQTMIYNQNWEVVKF